MCSRADTKQMAARGKVLALADSEEPLSKHKRRADAGRLVDAAEAVHVTEIRD